MSTDHLDQMPADLAVGDDGAIVRRPRTDVDAAEALAPEPHGELVGA
ncbi:hypothetical protein [Agromyces sp. SYSU T00194]